MAIDAQAVVRDVGEFGLIGLLRGALPPGVAAADDLVVGIGDDAAVWRAPVGATLVVTTDSLVEEVHFRLDWTDWGRLGHKVLAVNLSDLAAMGARARLAVVTLALRGDERVADVIALYHGLGALAERHGLLVVGGDIVRSPRALAFHVTAIGEGRGGRVLRRDGAKPGDLIAVSGTLGASAAGLRLLQLGPEARERRARTAERLIAAHLEPEPRLALGEVLLDAGATAAMDLSDGLLGDLPKILDASGVDAEIDEAALPIAAAVRAIFPAAAVDFAQRGGEDYELLFTIALDAFPNVAQRASAIGSTVTVIGRLLDRAGDRTRIVVRGSDGVTREEAMVAFDHFGSVSDDQS